MDTNTETTDSPGPPFNPLTGWETASRWNSAAMEWMARGFQQWLAYMATIPRQLLVVARPGDDAAALRISPTAPGAVTPAQAGARKERAARTSSATKTNARGSRLRGNDTIGHAVAKAEPKRPARSAAKPKAKPKPRARS